MNRQAPTTVLRCGGLIVLLGLSGTVPAEDQALGHIRFSYDFDGRCVQRNGEMARIANAHPDRGIKVYLRRYLADVMQPGRTVQSLPPGAEPVALGCTVVDGRPQRWQPVKAQFLP